MRTLEDYPEAQLTPEERNAFEPMKIFRDSPRSVIASFDTAKQMVKNRLKRAGMEISTNIFSVLRQFRNITSRKELELRMQEVHAVKAGLMRTDMKHLLADAELALETCSRIENQSTNDMRLSHEYQTLDEMGAFSSIR